MNTFMQVFSSYGKSSRLTRQTKKTIAGAMILFTLMLGGASFFQSPVAHGDGTDIAITKTVDSSAPNVGDTIHYTITVSATGSGTSAGVVANDALPSGVTFVSSYESTGSYDSGTGNWNIGDMASGSSQILVITATVNTGTAGEAITNTATASDANTSSVSAQAVINVTGTPTPPSADLAITKTVDNPTPSVGDTIHYTLTVAALGPATSTGVVATDTLPAGLTFVSATPSTGSYSSSTGAWTIGDMSPSTSQTLVITASVNSGTASTTITNTATVGESSAVTDPNTSNNTASVGINVQQSVATSTAPDAGLAITKTVDNPAPNAGDTIHYTITVAALGPATSTGVVATDTLPNGLTFVSANASTGSYASSTGVWTIGDMASSTSQTLVLAATVNAGTEGQTIVNTAGVSESASSTNTNAASSTASVPITVGNGTSTVSTTSTADLAITKTVDNPTPSVGDTIHYTLTVAALGPATSTGVVATDTLPAGLTFVSDIPSTGSYASSTGTWSIGDMGSGTSQTLVIAARVNSGTTSSTITNTATVNETASSTDPNLANNSSSVAINVQSATTTPTSTASLAITKTVDNPAPSVGDTIHYTITVAASGTATSTGVVATDTLPSGITFVSAIPSTGSYASSTGSWTIGDMATGTSQTLVIAATVNAGTAGQTIVNTASVASSTASASITVAGGGGGGGTHNASTTLTANPASITQGATSTLTWSSSNAENCQASGGWSGAQNATGTLTVTPTSTTTYTFTCQSNAGGAAASSSATVTVTAPTSTPAQITSFTAHPSSILIGATSTLSWTTVNATNCQASSSPAEGDWIGTVAASGTQMVTPLGSGTSVYTLACDSMNGGASTTASTTVIVGSATQADIAVTKTVDNPTPNVGDTIHYTVTVTDLGPATSTGVDVTDNFPAGLMFVSGNASTGTYSLSNGDWTIGNLAANAVATLVITAQVASTSASSTIVNTATVTESNSLTDPNLANNSSSVSITVSGGNTGGGGGGGGGGGNNETGTGGGGPGVTTGNTYSLRINNGATTTASQNVTLSLYGTDAIGMEISNTPDFTNASWSPYITQEAWVLTQGAGEKTVYARFEGQGGTVLATVNASIDLTTGSPVVSTTGTGAGAQTGQVGEVLGASTSCGVFLDDYIHPTRQDLNDPMEVEKLQVFLNQNLGINLAITGMYDAQTIKAVDEFQVKYSKEVLAPWVAYGLPSATTPTGYVYKTTRWWINNLSCSSLNTPMPNLP